MRPVAKLMCTILHDIIEETCEQLEGCGALAVLRRCALSTNIDTEVMSEKAAMWPSSARFGRRRHAGGFGCVLLLNSRVWFGLVWSEKLECYGSVPRMVEELSNLMYRCIMQKHFMNLSSNLILLVSISDGQGQIRERAAHVHLILQNRSGQRQNRTE